MLEIHVMNDQEVVVGKTMQAGTMHLYGSEIDSQGRRQVQQGHFISHNLIKKKKKEELIWVLLLKAEPTPICSLQAYSQYNIPVRLGTTETNAS